MSPQVVATSLAALRNAGSVFGLVLCNNQEIIYRDSPYPDQNVAELASTVDDIVFYFEEHRRFPDQLSFGYDGGNLLILIQGSFRLVLFHHNSDEADFVARAAKSFLKDYEMSLLVSTTRQLEVQNPGAAGPEPVSRRGPVNPQKRMPSPAAPINRVG